MPVTTADLMPVLMHTETNNILNFGDTDLTTEAKHNFTTSAAAPPTTARTFTVAGKFSNLNLAADSNINKSLGKFIVPVASGAGVLVLVVLVIAYIALKVCNLYS